MCSRRYRFQRRKPLSGRYDRVMVCDLFVIDISCLRQILMAPEA